MARRRLGVVLLLDDPVRSEVQGLRRACGDPMLDVVAPHLTLVPPVNVAEDDLGDALALLRREAARTEALALRLGPPETFLPVEPVLFLGVGTEGDAGEDGAVGTAVRAGAAHEVDEEEGDSDPALAALHDLRDRVFRPPLARPLAHPFVPHVTICASGTPGWIDQAARTLAAYEADVAVDRLHLLEEVHDERGRRWLPIADVPFAPPAVVARGGLEVELTTTLLVDPEAAVLLPGDLLDPTAGSDGPDGRVPLVVTARRDGEVLGVAAGLSSGRVAVLRRLAVGEHAAPGEDVARHLRAAFESEAAERGVLRVDEEPVVG